MQTSGLFSSHPASPRNANANSASDKQSPAAEGFGDVMHRALNGAGARPDQPKTARPLEEESREDQSHADKISAEKKRARSLRNSEHTSTEPNNLFGLAGAPVAASRPPLHSPSGNTEDSNGSGGSAIPVSEDSKAVDTEASSIEAESTDQTAAATPPKADGAAPEKQTAADGSKPPVAEAAAVGSLAAEAVEVNSGAADLAEIAGLTESTPENEQDTDAKPTPTEAGASSPDLHGTSAAKQDMKMKKADKTPKVADPAVQDLPGLTAAGSDESPKGQKISVKDSLHADAKLETVAVELPLRVVSSTDLTSPTATVAAPAASSTLDPRVIERTHDIVALHAMRVGEYNSDTLHVVVKPGAGIQLSLELRQSARGIEVRASLHKGDFDQLNQYWPDLQQRLEGRGVRVAALTTSENFMAGNHQQFQQSKQKSSQDDPLYAGAFAEFALAGSLTEAPAARAARATAYRGWETWA